MANGNQVKNGKSFEYALANEFYQRLTSMGLNVELVEDATLLTCKGYYEEFPTEQQDAFSSSARATIETMLKIEPGLRAQRDDNDKLIIRLAKDSEGQRGDVRDIVFSRPSANWEMGFSAKNNNDAVKHSRLSETLDFGKEWLDIHCSQDYWAEISKSFNYIDNIIEQQGAVEWSSLGKDKEIEVYIPILKAFQKEMLKINQHNKGVPAKLISYLIGKEPFYKIIKDDKDNLVIVKAFNIGGKLNQSVNGMRSIYKVERINLPTRVIEFDFKNRSTTTLIMTLDRGWAVSFRLHNADKKLEHSVKFDIRLIGNPPVLFSQYLFQE